MEHNLKYLNLMTLPKATGRCYNINHSFGIFSGTSEGTKYIAGMDFNPSFAIKTQSCYLYGGEITQEARQRLAIICTELHT